MAEPALASLIGAQQALIAALDADEVAAIESALLRFETAVQELRTAGDLRSLASARAQVEQALALAEAARIRTNYLADRTRRQLGRLAELGRTQGALAYGRNGRLRG